jgi:hypothetical protein
VVSLVVSDNVSEHHSYRNEHAYVEKVRGRLIHSRISIQPFIFHVYHVSQVNTIVTVAIGTLVLERNLHIFVHPLSTVLMVHQLSQHHARRTGLCLNTILTQLTSFIDSLDITY